MGQPQLVGAKQLVIVVDLPLGEINVQQIQIVASVGNPFFNVKLKSNTILRGVSLEHTGNIANDPIFIAATFVSDQIGAAIQMLPTVTGWLRRRIVSFGGQLAWVGYYPLKEDFVYNLVVLMTNENTATPTIKLVTTIEDLV